MLRHPASECKIWDCVEVRDAVGRALLVERPGMEWQKLLLPLSAGVTTCLVQAVEPCGGWPRTTVPSDRTIRDQANGGLVRIALVTNFVLCRAAGALPALTGCAPSA